MPTSNEKLHYLSQTFPLDAKGIEISIKEVMFFAGMG